MLLHKYLVSKITVLVCSHDNNNKFIYPPKGSVIKDIKKIKIRDNTENN